MKRNIIRKIFIQNLIPIAVAIITFFALSVIFYLEIIGINLLPLKSDKVLTSIKIQDVIVGLTIYLKTSIDFAIFIGVLMKNYPGLKNRFIIEIGTAAGNMLGTAAILLLWVFFKEFSPLLALMVFVASLVLLKMAYSTLEHVTEPDVKPGKFQIKSAAVLKKLLNPLISLISPILDKVIPHFNPPEENKAKTAFGLFLISFSVPFILGLDDFAGYVPLFEVVNVFGFGIGVFLGHAILNVLLFINPSFTTKVIKNPNISLIGAVAFVALAGYGIFESVKILFHIH